jgi:dTDP-4-amino-4,6-dideoxygalactose transaminase
MIHYPIPPHLQPAYRDLGYKLGDFPITEAIHAEVLSLPIGPTQTNEQTEFVAKTIAEFL